MTINGDLLLWQERISKLLKKGNITDLDFLVLQSYGNVQILLAEKAGLQRKELLSGKILGARAYQVLDQDGKNIDFVVDIFLQISGLYLEKYKIERISISETNGLSLYLNPEPNQPNIFEYCINISIVAIGPPI